MSDLAESLADQVRAAGADKRQLNIQGLSSKHFYGRATTPAQTTATLDISGHSGIVSYRPDELVITVRAGTALQDIRETLAASKQILSFEPPDFGEHASIGGTFACNQSGPARPWRGSVRDAVLGIRLINGLGERLRFGGEVMKNVAGYDASRLQAGAMGALGVITEVSLKTVPKPASTGYAQITVDDADTAITMMNNLSATPLPISGACWWKNSLHLRFEGAVAGVEGALTYCRQQWRDCDIVACDAEFWRDLRDQQLGFFDGDAPLWRLSVNAGMPALLPGTDWLIDWGGAQRWLRGDFDHSDWQARIPAGNGQATLFRHGDRSGDVFPPQPAAAQALHQRLKTAFDPQHIFNPQRLYSWL